MLDFSFGNALMHFRRTGAPQGFTWKFALSYLVAIALVLGISYYAMRPLIDFYIEYFAFVATNPEAANDPQAMQELLESRIGGMGISFLLIFVLILPLSLAFWAVFEASIQRRYIRKEGFRLAFGGDELRLMVVGLVVVILLYVVMLVGAILMGILVGVGTVVDNAGVTILSLILGYVAMLGLMIWYLARMSAASALTIRDQQIRIFDSFNVTKGRVWPILGAFLIIWIVSYIVTLAVYALGAGVVISQFTDLISAAGEPDTAALYERLKTPSVWVSIVISFALIYLVYGLTMIVSAGPGALAALNDPRRPGQGHDLASTFT